MVCDFPCRGALDDEVRTSEGGVDHVALACVGIEDEGLVGRPHAVGEVEVDGDVVTADACRSPAIAAIRSWAASASPAC